MVVMDGGSNRCGLCDEAHAYALRALPPADDSAMESHVQSCPDCREQLDSLQPLLKLFAAWPSDVLAPPNSLREGLADRLAAETGAEPCVPRLPEWAEPAWKSVAPGIECKLLATDEERHRVSMLVRLEPGASYPAHTHAGVEELHLLDGELWIDQRKLFPGDYNYGAPGAGDDLVFSETGCTCVLVTSTKDILR